MFIDSSDMTKPNSCLNSVWILRMQVLHCNLQKYYNLPSRSVAYDLLGLPKNFRANNEIPSRNEIKSLLMKPYTRKRDLKSVHKTAELFSLQIDGHFTDKCIVWVRNVWTV